MADKKMTTIGVIVGKRGSFLISTETFLPHGEDGFPGDYPRHRREGEYIRTR